MADIYWDRIEPHTRDVDLEEGLQMRLCDPLFMLARQWQVGEFRGEDAASPIHVQLEVEHAKLETFRSDARAGEPVEPFPHGRPLESRVEAETVAPASLGFAAESGLSLLRRLDDAGLGHLRAKLRAEYGLVLRPEDSAGLPERELRRLRLYVRGAVDGVRLRTADTQEVLGIAAAADRDSEAVLTAWRSDEALNVDEPGGSGETWVDDRLEHRFSIAATTEKDEVVLAAAEYPGGHLDWHSFDRDGAEPHKLDAHATEARTLNRLPVPLAYAGMPRSRLWELEEGKVYFGGIEAGPGDIGRIVVAEYATVYSDNWFLLPVRFPTASIARVTSAVVLNTFGERHTVHSVAQTDEEDPAVAERVWAFCELSGDDSAANGETPWLVLLPTLTATQNGRPLEAVSFIRDEAANLAWAIEERIESATGGSIRRRLTTARAADADGAAAPAGRSGRRGAPGSRGAAVALPAPVGGGAVLDPARPRAD